MTKKIVGALFAVVGIVGVITFIQSQAITNLIAAIACFSVATYFLLIYKQKTTEEIVAKKNAEDKRKQENEKLKDLNDRTIFSAAHQTGLPLAEGTICSVVYKKDYFKISGGGVDFKLSCEKITDVTMTTDVELQRSYVSSIGGAVGGAVLFGPLGAMIGGRTKKKDTKTITRYLVFTYIKDNEIQYVAFDVTGEYLKALSLIKQFQSTHTKNIQSVKEVTL